MTWIDYILILFGILLMLYCALIVLYNHWFQRLKPFQIQNTAEQLGFSIIIPARNEEGNIGRCLASIVANNYPNHLYEIIVINDNSTDNTVVEVQFFIDKGYPIRLLQMSNLITPHETINAYKKLAIEKAVAISSFDWIITTDADCVVGKNWLAYFSAFIQAKEAYFVAAPVQFSNDGRFLSIFQCLDFLTLQGITAASVYAGFHSMCNGANLCYKKSVFFEVEGFKGVDHLASGDDMFLMEKIQKKYPHRIQYLFAKSSIVVTLPMPTLKSFINQRIRWASKSDSYQDERMIVVLFLVYCLNLTLLLLPLCCWAQPSKVWIAWFIGFAMKTVVEFIFVRNVCRFFEQQRLAQYFFIMQPFHIIYTVVAGWLGKFGRYEWKGRQVQ